MNKLSTLYILLLVILFSQCTKKASEVMQETSPEAISIDQSWRSQTPSAGPARAIEIGDYQLFELNNGLKVIVVENHKLPRVSYQLTLNNDPILEKDKVGYVSMAGSLISKGTNKRSKAELDEAIDFIGANISSSGSGMFASSLKKHQTKLLDLMTEMLYEPSFPQEEFDKLMKQSVSGLSQIKTDPNSIAANVASVVNYGKDHVYGEIETEKSLSNISNDDCKNYYNTYFKPNNAYLIIVGDITLEEAKSTAGKYFESWQKGEIIPDTHTTPSAPSENRVVFANKDGAAQSVIRVTYPLDLKPGSDDVIKAGVMNSILGGGVFSGRLMQNLREDKAYTYGARSSLSSNQLIGSFNASASVRNEVTDSSVVQFLLELERMISEDVDQKDLQLSKNSIAGSFARSLESPQTIARFARNTFKYNLPPDYYNTYLEKLEAVSITDVKQMAQKYIRPNGANIVVVGSKDEVAEKLLPFDGDGVVEYFGPFGESINNDDTAIPEGVTAATIINDFIEASGGKAAMENVTTIKNEMTMSVMGQQANVTLLQKKPKMLSLTISLQGMTLQEQKFNGDKALTAAMGNKKVFTEGSEYETLKEQADIFSQLNYDNYTLELKGIEDINGKKAYKVAVTSPSGNKTTEFYDISTSLMIRTVSTQKGPNDQEMIITTDVGDYKEVAGIMIPHIMTISGAMPQPMTMESNNMVINMPIDDALFIIE